MVYFRQPVLAYHRERAHPRDHLIDLLWPEADLASGR
jgi:DNA-binding SARP family transcriptional activator